jgi:hypothetical protein
MLIHADTCSVLPLGFFLGTLGLAGKCLDNSSGAAGGWDEAQGVGTNDCMLIQADTCSVLALGCFLGAMGPGGRDGGRGMWPFLVVGLSFIGGVGTMQRHYAKSRQVGATACTAALIVITWGKLNGFRQGSVHTASTKANTCVAGRTYWL